MRLFLRVSNLPTPFLLINGLHNHFCLVSIQIMGTEFTGAVRSFLLHFLVSIRASVPNCGRIRPMWPNWTLTWPRDFYFFGHFFSRPKWPNLAISLKFFIFLVFSKNFGYFFKKLTFSKKYFVILAQLCFKS